MCGQNVSLAGGALHLGGSLSWLLYQLIAKSIKDADENPKGEIQLQADGVFGGVGGAEEEKQLFAVGQGGQANGGVGKQRQQLLIGELLDWCRGGSLGRWRSDPGEVDRTMILDHHEGDGSGEDGE